MSEEASSRREEIIKMVTKVKQSASIIKDEKHAKDLLDLFLLP